MRIAIIGRVNPSLVYNEWKIKLQQNVEITNVKQINITIGNGILNQYARKYAAACDIPVKEYAADFKTHGTDARLIRNKTLIADSDIVVSFISQGNSTDVWISSPGISTEKPIYMKEIIKREPKLEDLMLLDAVCKEDLLTVDEEVELIKQIRQNEGDVEAAKEKLMRANQRFVRAVANQYVSAKHSIDALMTEGNLGLEYAILKYDETRGFKFITYAIWWIRESIRRYIASHDKTVDLHSLDGLSNREIDIIRMYFGFGCKKGTLEDIQAKYNLSPQRVIYIKDKALRKLFKSNEKLSTVRVALMGEVENKEKI